MTPDGVADEWKRLVCKYMCCQWRNVGKVWVVWQMARIAGNVAGQRGGRTSTPHPLDSPALAATLSPTPMPSPPGSHPSRQLTVRLPWHVWARLVALAAADPHGARPGRVAATALDRGVEVLERAAALRGAGGTADAPTGQPGVTVRALTAEQADAITAENDRRWPGDRGAVG